MRRLLLIVAALLLPGGLLAAGAVWLSWRRRSSAPGETSSVTQEVTETVADFVRSEGGRKFITRRRYEAAHASPKLQAFMDEVPSELGMDLVVGEKGGDRTDADQLGLYAIGRTVDLHREPVTNARDTSQTAHGIKSSGLSYAIDVYPTDADGKARGMTPEDAAKPEVIAMFDRIRDAAEARGLVSGSRFKLKSGPDRPHVEDPAWQVFRPKTVATS